MRHTGNDSTASVHSIHFQRWQDQSAGYVTAVQVQVTQIPTMPPSSKGPEQAERMDEQGRKVVRLVEDRRGTSLM